MNLKKVKRNLSRSILIDGCVKKEYNKHFITVAFFKADNFIMPTFNTNYMITCYLYMYSIVCRINKL